MPHSEYPKRVARASPCMRTYCAVTAPKRTVSFPPWPEATVAAAVQWTPSMEVSIA